ncbi:hypothetical protein EDC44_1474, partial [Cricetibacter osteomyelitidis]
EQPSKAATTNDQTPGLVIEKGLKPEEVKLYDDNKEVPASYDPATGVLTPKAPLSEGEHALSYTKTEAGKGESAKSDPINVKIDTIAPSAPAVTANTDGTVDVKVPADAKEGDTVEVSVTPENAAASEKVTLTKKGDVWESDKPTIVPAIPKDQDTAKIPADQVKDGSKVTVQGKDSAGNQSAPVEVTAENPDATRVPGTDSTGNQTDAAKPQISFTEDVNNDAKLNKAEVGTDNSTPVKVTLPADGHYKVGDKLVLAVDGQQVGRDGKASAEAITLTETDLTDGVSVPVAVQAAHEGNVTVVAKVSNPNNSSANNVVTSLEKTVSVDTKDPSAPAVTANTDGTVDVKVPADAKEGDTVEVSVTPENAAAPEKVTLTKKGDVWESDKPTIVPAIPKGQDTAKIPADQVKDGSKVTVQGKDSAGNQSAPVEVTAENPDATRVPGTDSTGNQTDAAKPQISFTEDVNNDAKLNKAEVGTDNSTTVKVTLPADGHYKVGDKLVLAVDGQQVGRDGKASTEAITLTEADLTDGVSVPVAVQAAHEGNVTVIAKVSNPNNSSANNVVTSLEKTVAVDTKDPTQPMLVATKDGSVEVSLPIDAKADDKAVVSVPKEGGTIENVTLTKQLNGKWISDKPETIANPMGDKATISANKVKDNAVVMAKSIDSAGNESATSSTTALPPPPQVPTRVPAKAPEKPSYVSEDTSNIETNPDNVGGKTPPKYSGDDLFLRGYVQPNRSVWKYAEGKKEWVNKDNGHVTSGDGNDRIEVLGDLGRKDDPGTTSMIIDTGAGNDVVLVNGKNISNTVIKTGAGDDYILLNAGFGYKATSAGTNVIDAGAGNDRIVLGQPDATNAKGNVRITGGAGDDVIVLTHSYNSEPIGESRDKLFVLKGNHPDKYSIGGKEWSQPLIEGDYGFDTLQIQGNGTRVNLRYGKSEGPYAKEEGIRGFEAVDMTAEGNQHVKIRPSDLLYNGEYNGGKTFFYISGNKGDKVDISGFTKDNSDKLQNVKGFALDDKEHSYTAYKSVDGKDVVYVDDNLSVATINWEATY